MSELICTRMLEWLNEEEMGGGEKGRLFEGSEMRNGRKWQNCPSWRDIEMQEKTMRWKHDHVHLLRIKNGWLIK